MTDVQTDADSTESRADGLLENLSGAILWEVEAGTLRLSFLSESAAALLGAPDPAWEADAGLLKKHVHSEDWGRFLETLYQAATEGGVRRCEHRLLRRDGSLLWAQTTVQRSSRSNGTLLLTGLSVDISTVKQRELELHDAEFHSRLLFENIRDYGVFMLALDGSVATWSPGAQRLKGYRSDEAIGLPLSRFFPVEEVHKGTPQRLLEQATLERRAEYEGWMLRKGGESFWASLTLSAVTDDKGRLRGFSNVARDLTERRRTELALKESEEHFRRLVESQDYGVFMASPTGIVESWNRGAQRLSGYRSHEVIGTPMSRLFPADVGEKGLTERLLTEAGRLGRADYEGWLVRKGGETFWGLVTVSSVEDESGYLRGFSLLTRDVTERRRTEMELRRSEQYFRLMVDSVQDYGVFMLSTEGVVETWNQGAQRLKGYRAQEAIGAPLSRFFPPEENAKGTPERLLAQALEGSATYEGWMLRKGGGRFWALVTLSAVEDEAGHVQGISNVARDLTDRKRAEDAMRHSEERLRLLIDSVHDYGVFMLSPSGTVASWNPGAERMKRYRAEEIIGAPFSWFFTPEQVKAGIPEQLIQRATAEGHAEFEGWMLRKGGVPFWASLTLSAVMDAEGHLRGLSNVARDLTERMRAERSMTFLAEVGRVLADSLDYHTTLDRVAQLATRDLAQVCIVEMLVGSTLQRVAVAQVDASLEALVHDAVRRAMPGQSETQLSPGVARVVQTGQSELLPEVSNAGQLGEALGLEDPDILRTLGTKSYLCVPLTARGKTFGGMVFVAAAGRHYAAADLFLAEELGRRAALAMDNARLYEQAQQASRMREDVLAVVSHDLRNPLGTIRAGASQILAETRDDARHAKTARTAERIGRASERMLHMIRDLLDFSSIEAGQLRIEAAEHEVSELVSEVVEMLHPIAAEKDIHLQRDEGTSHLRVRCDRERIIQVLSNLIGNAIKFTAGGGSIVVRSRGELDRVIFSVTDTGSGISPEERVHVFDRYWQAQKEHRESLGLGLAISKAIIESHGGTLWVESAVGVGTTFFFTLPVGS